MNGLYRIKNKKKDSSGLKTQKKPPEIINLELLKIIDMTLKMTLLSWGKGTEGRSGRPKFRSKQSCLFKVFQSKNFVMKSTFSCLLKPVVTLTRC